MSRRGLLNGGLTLLIAGGIGAFGPVDADAASRATGLGDAVIALPDPALIGRDNPAFLGAVGARGLRRGRFDVGVAVGNSAFSLADYTEYNGAVLTEADEDEILSRVGEDGWRFSGDAVGYGPTLAFGPVAFDARGVGAGAGTVPREVLELIFDGNVVGETVDFSDAEGGGWAAVEGSVAFGHSFDGLISGGETAIGVRGRYVRGLFVADITRADGRIVTEVDTIYGEGNLDVRTATGGRGYAVDVGVVHHRRDWNVGLRAVGLGGSITWDTETELTEYRVEGGLLDPFENESGEVDQVSSSDTTLAIGSFRTELPTRVGVGVAHQRGGWILAADVEHTSRGRLSGERPLRFSLGTERMLLGRHLRPRVGMMLGGLGGPTVAGGLSFVFGPWRLDLDAGSYATMNPVAPRGLRFAMGSGFVFG